MFGSCLHFLPQALNIISCSPMTILIIYGFTSCDKNPKFFNISWAAPPPGIIKINTDRAFDPTTQRAFAGGLIQDSQGHWIAGFTFNIGKYSILHADLWAIYEGLKLAWQHGYQQIEIES